MKTITKRSKKTGNENEEKREQEKKLKTKQYGTTSQWKIKNIKILPKNLGYTLEFHCSKCGKRLSLKDIVCCFDPNRKIESGIHKDGLYSAFFCEDCIKKNEHELP
jgi:hypothetical protein